MIQFSTYEWITFTGPVNAIKQKFGIPSFGILDGYQLVLNPGTLRWSEPIFSSNKDEKRVLSEITDCMMIDDLEIITRKEAIALGWFAETIELP